MVFREFKSKNGLKKLFRISYNLKKLTSMLLLLDKAAEEQENLISVSVYSIIKEFKRGLYIVGIVEIGGDEAKGLLKSAQYQVIRHELSKNKEKYIDLLNCITEIENYISANSYAKKEQKY